MPQPRTPPALQDPNLRTCYFCCVEHRGDYEELHGVRGAWRELSAVPEPGSKCAYCGKVLSGEDPEAKGGAYHFQEGKDQTDATGRGNPPPGSGDHETG